MSGTIGAKASDADWWRHAVVYQIYPRSFADGDGDGVGDFEGLLERIPYLADLGVDAVWLNPFYPSALADGGYDVDDYRDVDPRIGTLNQLDTIIEALHRVGIRLIIDIVPNHSGSGHLWFKAALASSPKSAERARYIFRDGRGYRGEFPPSDWRSHFGGPAWTRVPDGQWYLHLFGPQQPDFDWSNAEVRAEFLSILRFWSDRAVDGFRVDVAHGLAKDLSEPFRTSSGPPGNLVPSDGSDPLFDRDDVHEIFRGWRSVLNEYTPPRAAVGEVLAPPSRVPLYARSDELGQVFAFDLSDQPWSSASFEAAINRTLLGVYEFDTAPTWTLSNHDLVRHATRFALPRGTDTVAWLMTNGSSPHEDRDLGTARARAAILLLLALPGSIYLYQGEELGLFEVADISFSDLEDPIWKRSDQQEKGRDGARVPMPWSEDGPSFGFGPGSSHLPQPEWFNKHSVERQSADDQSILNLYRRAINIRKSMNQTFSAEVTDSDGSLEIRRTRGFRSVTAFDVPTLLPDGEIILSSHPVGEDRVLRASATAWLRS